MLLADLVLNSILPLGRLNLGQLVGLDLLLFAGLLHDHDFQNGAVTIW